MTYNGKMVEYLHAEIAQRVLAVNAAVQAVTD